MSETKTSPEFDKLYAVLNIEQRKAVDTIDGPVMVIAGPGTGKTTILTLRIANIIRLTDTSPDSILALTFTESGAFAMRRKLVEIIGQAAYKVRIETFHGFADGLIRDYPDYFPRIIGSNTITESDQIKIVREIISSSKIKLLRPYGDETYYVRPVLSEIHHLKSENIHPRAFMESVKADKKATAQKELKKGERERLEKRDAKNAELAFVYEGYEAQLAKKKYYDFDDMLLEVIRLMEEDQSFKLMIQEQYQYILADEHQDANASQNRILELLADFYDSPNLFIVGDDKQAIYRFQGASLENFLYFSKKYPGAVVIDLKHNYRSHQGILDASHSLIEKNPGIPGRERTRLISLQIGTKPIFVDEFPTLNEELQYLATLLERLIKRGEKPEDVAILYRENKQAGAVAQALRSLSVPYRIESDRNLLDDPDPTKIIILCRAIHDPANDEYLGQALLLPEMACDPASVSEAFAVARKSGKPLHLVLKSSRDELTKAYEKIRDWSGQAAVLPFPDFLQRLIRETGMLASITQAPDSLERLSSLQVFFDRIVEVARSKKVFRLPDFLEDVEIMSDHGLTIRRSFAEHQSGVRLMTAHRAKGLEFNHVFLVQAVDGSWGNRSKRSLFSIPIIEGARDSGRIEDERRLFYVALTRARESVNISYSLFSGQKETVPSQFISEIDPTLVSFERPKLPDLPAASATRLGAPSVMPSPILDREFIRSKFLAQPFSVTHLNNYLTCPWRYFFSNLLRVPQAITKHQMYGTAVHAALRAFFLAYSEEKDFSKKKLIEVFRSEIDRTSLYGLEKKESFNKGKKALEGYYDEYFPTWGRALKTEYSLSGDHINLQLTGKLDKIEFINDTDVLVVDFKTAKPKSRNEIEGKTAEATGDYKRQLVFYKLLLEATGKYKMVAAEIDFIEPNDRGIYKKERFEITDEEVAALKETIERVGKEIMDLTFVSSTCGDKDCEYCKLGSLVVKK